MHANFTCEVVCVSSALIPVAQQALEILEGAASDFRFHLAGMPQVISEGGGRTPRLAPWTSTELSALLSAERTARKCARLIGVLEEPLENNWFSNTAYGRDVAWITTHNWEFYSHLPVASFVAYDLVLNGVLMQAVKRPQEEAWLMNEVVHAHETRGCISDLCVFKPDISLKIQSGFICPDCQRIFAQRLGSATLEAVQGLLKRISETCKPTEPGTSIHDFPALERMRDRLEKTKGSAKAKLGCRTDYLTKNLKDLAAQSESLSEHERQLIKELEQVRAHRTQLADQAAQLQKEVEVAHREQEVLYSRSESFLAVPANGSKQVGGLGRPGLHDEVERRYPFPIAYCFRSLRAELNPTDRWLALYELYTLIIRYLTFVLLAEQSRSNEPLSDELRSRIRKLQFGSGGDWGRACVGLLERLRNLPDSKTCLRTLRDSIARDAQGHFEGTAFDDDVLRSFEIESRDLVKDRNRSFGHGFRGSKEDAQRLYERHLPGIKTMLSLIAPLAELILFRPMQILANVGGECVFVSKILMGANPLFLVEEMSGKTVPETVCQLLLPDDVQSTVSLHPWLDLTNCTKCGRDMMFIYDALFSDAGREKVLFLEYPSNHEKFRPELCAWVRQALGS